MNMIIPLVTTLCFMAFAVHFVRLGGPSLRKRLGIAFVLFGNDIGATNFITDVIDIPDLVGYVRETAILQPPTLLGGIVDELEVEDLDYELVNIDPGFINIARYRSWDTAPPLGKRAGFATIRGEILPLGLSLTLNEKEMKRLTSLLAALGVRDGTADATTLRDIYDDGVNCGLACRARYEIAIGDLFHDGVVTINENGAIVTADFGVPGAHLVTAATAWSDRTNSTPVTNLLAWEATYRTNNGGRNPDAWLVSSAVMSDLQFNAQVRTLSVGVNNGVTPGVVGVDGVGNVLRAAGVRAPIVVFDGQVPDNTGAATPTLPVRDVIAVRQGMSSVLYGTTPSADAMVRRGEIEREEAAGIIVYVEETVRPARVITTGEAVGLPVLRDPKALFRAVV